MSAQARRHPDRPRIPGAPYSVAQAAAALNISERAVYALCERGEIGHCRMGPGRGLIRIPEADLEEYKVATRVGPAPPAGGTGLAVRNHLRLKGGGR